MVCWMRLPSWGVVVHMVRVRVGSRVGYVQECNEQGNIDRDAVSPETRHELLRDALHLC